MPWRFNPFTGNLDETDIPAFSGEVTLGSAANPSIFFTGDTNTGIYSPGADQLALSTNGTGRLFVFSSGEISTRQGGFTSIPDGAGSNFTPQIFSSKTSGVAGLGVYVEDGTNNRRAGLFVDQTNAIWGLSSLWSTGQPDFVIRAATNERLRITSAGLVGIGTSVPAVPLNISSSANGTPATSGTTQTHGSFRIGSSATTGCIDFGPNGPNPWIQATDRTNLSQNYNLLLNPNGGRVGIGTTPDARLTIQDGANIVARVKQLALDSYSNEGPGITFGRISDGVELSAVGVVDSDKLLLASREGIFFGVGGAGLYSAVSEAARIDSSGRLLIGTFTTSDTKAKLGVAGSVNIGAGSGNSVTLADGATGTVATPVRGYSYINISQSNTTADGLLLLVFANSNFLTIVNTVHSNAGTGYSASVSGRNLQVTNALGVSATFYASCMTLAWGNNG